MVIGSFRTPYITHRLVGSVQPNSLERHFPRVDFIRNLRIYVSGADLWEKSYITDGWDPEATRKVENKQRYPFNRTVTFGVNATF